MVLRKQVPEYPKEANAVIQQTHIVGLRRKNGWGCEDILVTTHHAIVSTLSTWSSLCCPNRLGQPSLHFANLKGLVTESIDSSPEQNDCQNAGNSCRILEI